MAITKTPLCLTVTCKCGGVVAATMLYGGDTIDEDFTNTIADVFLRGGKVEVVDTRTEKITLGGCECP